MSITIDRILSLITSKIDGGPNDDPDLCFKAVLFSRNIVNLCGSIKRISENIKSKKILDLLPPMMYISACKRYFSRFFNDSMFIVKDSELVPNWEEINRFDKIRMKRATLLYSGIKENINAHPISASVQHAILCRDKKYFIDNFDILAKSLLIKLDLTKVKEVLTSDDIPEDDQDYVWMLFVKAVTIITDGCKDVEVSTDLPPIASQCSDRELNVLEASPN